MTAGAVIAFTYYVGDKFDVYKKKNAVSFSTSYHPVFKWWEIVFLGAASSPVVFTFHEGTGNHQPRESLNLLTLHWSHGALPGDNLLGQTLNWLLTLWALLRDQFYVSC